MTKIIKGKRKVSVDLTARLSNMFNLENQNYSKEA
jgi:plasmid maintenance system antidote protein VapI